MLPCGMRTPETHNVSRDRERYVSGCHAPWGLMYATVGFRLMTQLALGGNRRNPLRFIQRREDSCVNFSVIFSRTILKYSNDSHCCRDSWANWAKVRLQWSLMCRLEWTKLPMITDWRLMRRRLVRHCNMTSSFRYDYCMYVCMYVYHFLYWKQLMVTH